MRVAVVTGAAKGIGYGIAEKFCETGYTTALLGRGKDVRDRAEELKQNGYPAYGYLCDVTDEDAVNKTIAEIKAHFGKIDILVNNAGIAKLTPFEATGGELLDQHIEVNLKGAWYMLQAVLPIMREQNCGRIINMSSVTGAMVSDKGYSAYGMTKAGLIGLTKVIAAEYAEYGITCNAICPGFILTPNVQRSASVTNPDDPEEVLDRIAKGVPLKRLGTAREVGALAVFLSGEEAGYITGTVNVIDGGNLLPETNVMGIFKSF